MNSQAENGGRATGRRSLRLEPDRGHPALSREGKRASPGPAGVGNRQGWAAPRKLGDEWTAPILPTRPIATANCDENTGIAAIDKGHFRAGCPLTIAGGVRFRRHGLTTGDEPAAAPAGA